ncbi:hypothetical protein EYZ11_004201 [Aspergillus tanneri]|uniref:Nonribosomal peptide synthetases (NRPS) n=1 Tax=Aspergillus tanneri TaxID=1220188 RepID=A0A4S3JL49_9EURO|nr:Nonribosomal peptide synthetases (NRPS) [Aspergillus tanneri]KAA8647997.1 Nonribosomal peptide synthetases (NRPS) [Aspergillus tanneri]THC96296.1 hypothetical protein EYZ11_004201 [Aspergillus tanneri]
MTFLSEPPQTSLAEAWDRHPIAMPIENLSNTLSRAAAEHPDQPAVVSLHQSQYRDLSSKNCGMDGAPLKWTFSQLQEQSRSLATYFLSNGVVPGRAVVTFLFNQAEAALLFWATAHMGCRFVPLDPRSLDRLDEASHLLRTSEPAIIVADTAQTAAQADRALLRHCSSSVPSALCHRMLVARETEITPEGWSHFPELVKNPAEGYISLSSSAPSLPGIHVHMEDPVVMFFTSGTTSLPKACPLSTINIVTPAVCLASKIEAQKRDAVIQQLPHFHSYSLVVSIGIWLSGGTVVFPSARFEPASSIGGMEYAAVNGWKMHLPCVPSMLQAIASHPACPAKVPALSSVIVGGAPVLPEVLAILKSLGSQRIAVGFGMTEGTITLLSIIDTGSLRPRHMKEVSVGTAQSGARVRICAPGSRIPLRRGEVGELHEGGLPVFRGYLGVSDPACYREDGMDFIATGDQAYMDHVGQVYIIGRYKDIIIRGGENISPATIEGCLGNVQGVMAQVVGVPDPVAGEVPIAVVRCTAQKVSAKALQKMVLVQLGPAFVPPTVLDLQCDLNQEQFPTTSTGKIQKFLLRQWVTEHLARCSSIKGGLLVEPLDTQLSILWSTLCGQHASDILPDTSILKIADSMMIIQFCGLVRKELHKTITMQEVIEADTIRKQAKLLRSKKARPSEDTGPNIQAIQNSISMDELQRNSKEQLTRLGLGWSDVEYVIPMTDTMKVMVKGRRPYSWNHRHCLIIDSTKPEQLVSALKRWLERHHLLRSTSIINKDTAFYLVMRPQESWFLHQIVMGGKVMDAQAFSAFRANDLSYDLVTPSGPLVKVTVLDVGVGSSTMGLVLHIHHCIFDGLTIQRWYQDLAQLLRNCSSDLSFHPYRDFGLLYHQYRSERLAQKSIDFHVRRLRGVSTAKEAFWPAQRSPYWLKGDDQGWIHDDGTPGQTAERIPLDGLESRGTVGLVRTAHIPNLSSLRSSFGISPPFVAKCACALVNMKHTGANEAIFASIESGRSQLPNNGPTAVSIDLFEVDGPTTNETLNRIRLEPGETVIRLLTRIQRYQSEIDLHSHAPIYGVRDALAQDPITGEADAREYISLLQRQVFDWLPPTREANNDLSVTLSPLRLLEILPRTDLGIVWFPSLSDSDILELEVTYDDSQLTTAEVRQAMTEFMSATAWLANPDNIQRPVSDCQFDGLQITDIEPHYRYRR